MSNWRNVSRTSTPISPSNGMSDGARKPMNKIKMMNSLPLERNM